MIAIVGGMVFLIGLILVPYPGPGWLTVFAGLAILATEFHFAANLLALLRKFYQRWAEWLKRQPRWVQLVVLSLTGLVVVVTIWLLNGFGFVNYFLNLNQDWLSSPIFW